VDLKLRKKEKGIKEIPWTGSKRQEGEEET
jgi:hypothetical protein